MVGGLALPGSLTDGSTGTKPDTLLLDQTRQTIWRAGHAHAGVCVVLTLSLHPLVDQTALSKALQWEARTVAPIASILVPAGFFGLAFFPAFKPLIYLDIVCLAASMLLTKIGLLRNTGAFVKCAIFGATSPRWPTEGHHPNQIALALNSTGRQ